METDPVVFGKHPKEDNDFERFDITGYFYWCPHKTLEESLLVNVLFVTHHIFQIKQVFHHRMTTLLFQIMLFCASRIHPK